MLKKGMKKDSLKIIEFIDSTFMIVECKCGKHKKIYRGNWNKVKTCGDCGRGLAKIIVEPGNVFDCWTVLREGEKVHDTRGWYCKCICGKEQLVREANLKSHFHKSCGCIRRGKTSHNYNGYEYISGTYWSRIVNGAKIRNLEFNITIQDAFNQCEKQEKKCAISGVELYFPLEIGGKNINLQTASLDRIDNSKGYIINNIQWIHKDVNKLKTNFEQDKFINWCKIISKFQEI